MDGKTYDAILWLLDYLNNQEVPADITECMQAIRAHLDEVEKEYLEREEAGVLSA